MPIKVPPIILSLINDPDEDFNPLQNSDFFNMVIKVDRLASLYYSGDNGLTSKQLEPWYQTSVTKDNFINLFKGEAVNKENLVLKEYEKLVKVFGNEPYKNNTTDWNKFFAKTEKKLLPKVSARSVAGNMTVGTARNSFKDLANYSSTTKIKTLLKSSPANIATEVLKAWSFYLTLKNFTDIQPKIESKTRRKSAEKVDFENENILSLYNQIIDNEATKKQKIEEIIKEFNTANVSISSSKFNKQKYLIENIEELSHLSVRRQAKEQYFKLGVPQNRIIRITNSKKNAINKITGAARGNEMFKMPTYQLSKLVPTIQLFKVVYNEKMESKPEVKIDFPTTFVGSARNSRGDIDPLGEVKTKREYGIKSFSWEYKGSDPFSVDRDITATLELYFQNFGDFTAQRDGYRYVDLIVPLEKCYPQAKAILGENFQQDIRVKAGWEVPQSLKSELELANALPEDTKEDKDRKSKTVRPLKEKIASIKASQVNFILHPIDYNISFDGNGNGASTITINYRARIESVGKNRLINVIGANKEEVERIQESENRINNTDDDKEKKKFRQDQQQIYKEIRKDASRRYIKKLASNACIYIRDVNLEEVFISNFGEQKAKEYYKSIKFGEQFTPGNRDLLKDTLDEIKSKPGLTKNTIPLVTGIAIKPVKGDEKPVRIEYTFLADILQVAIDMAVESGSLLGAPQSVLDNFKIALLDFRVGDRTYNLSNLPISTNVLVEFLNNKIGKRSESTVSIVAFAKELISEVLINRIDEYFNLADGTTRSFKLGYIQMFENLKTNSLGSYSLINSNDIRELNKSKKIDYLIIYSDSPVPSDYKISPLTGGYGAAKRRDEANGLHHFALGTTKGIVKNISFDRVDLEYARERRMTMNSEDPYALLANVFNVNISMFGNNFFRPGSYIYVDPKVMGDLGNPWHPGSISNIMGLGGYHIITGVSHQITLQSFETSIDAVWETSGDGQSSFTGLRKNLNVEGKEKKDKDKC